MNDTTITAVETKGPLPVFTASVQGLLRAVTEKGAAACPQLAPQGDATGSGFVPMVPETLEDTGLAPALIEQLIVKKLHFQGQLVGRELAQSLGLKFSLIEEILDLLKRQRLVEVRSSLGYGSVSAAFTLTEAGRVRAREFLDNNQYSGPAPVPMGQYVRAVRAQRLKSGWLTKEALSAAYQHMVVSPQVLAQIGPAVNSGKSFLLYGQPGNGKTYLAEALFGLQSSPIYIPFALEYEGMIIRLFDPVYHHRLDQEPAQEESVLSVARESSHDGRWSLCRRPFLVTGGELTLDMLDLSFNPSAKVYDAPFQLKANNGIYLIDDFGRQRVTPAEVLNRWIVPMDRRVDYLTFHTGGKVEVPFENFLIFSTNLRPEQLGDEAFLRRISYKMLVQSPNEEEFQEIFRRFCITVGLAVDPELIGRFLEKHYRLTGKQLRRCHPRDVISHAIDLMNFERMPHELTEAVLNQAFETCFVNENGAEDSNPLSPFALLTL